MTQCFRAVVVLFALIAVPLPIMAQGKPVAATGNSVRPNVAQEMKLGRLAPDKCVLFLAGNGWSKPQPGSTNKTEQLWAEESVQEFLTQLSNETQKTIERQSTDAESSLMATTLPVLLKAAVQHPLAISLNRFTASETPEIDLSVVIDAESDAAQVREAFEKLIQQARKSNPDSLAEETIDGVTFYLPRESDDKVLAKLLPRVGMFDSYLILTMGPTTTTETLARIRGKGKSPAWLNGTLTKLNVDRPSLALYVDVEAIWNTVDPLIDDPTVRATLEATGVMGIQRISYVSGLDAIASVDKFALETKGAPRGALALLPEKPLQLQDFKSIPANPVNASLIRFDLKQVVEGVLKITDQADPMIRQQFDGFCGQVEPMLGFAIKGDLLEAFGDLWSTYVSGTEAGGGLVPGLVVSASVRDQKKLTKVHDALIGLTRQFLQQMGPQSPVSLHEFTARSAKGYRVQINNLPLPIAPTWVITKDQFVLGLSPQLVTAHLSAATAKTSLADNPDIKAALARNPKSILISYRDPKPEIQGYYTLVNMFSPVVLGQLQQQGIEFDFPPLPPYSDLEPHLAPSVMTLSREPMGWSSESHGVVSTLSVGSPAVAGVMVALLLPAVQQAREAARRTQAKNNLKQIGLAMHVHHDAAGSFPPRVTAAKNGKPGLSWRVKILPYIDQKALYDQFHLDEPWDSEHNKTLIARMPVVYATPGDDAQAKAGRTQYLVLNTPGSLFQGEDGPKISSITDGTSNTIMVVEARADQAVVWTKPDDLDIDLDNPLSGLESARVGGFHALLADGSVRFISNQIDLKTLKALFTRAGNETIGGF